ncbi:MFS transporter [Diplocarpon mali]|nr:MFS transporter [Diplocarpon mali]
MSYAKALPKTAVRENDIKAGKEAAITFIAQFVGRYDSRKAYGRFSDESGVVAETDSEQTAEDRALLRKQDLRIVPLCAAIYLLCNAKTLDAATHDDLLLETHMANYQYIIALMVFLVAYAIFEVPSNYLLNELSPNRWISFLMFSWQVGTLRRSVLVECRTSQASRLFPGLVYYLTFWYRTEERSIRVAFILASATLAGAFGVVIAYGVGHMDWAAGHSAWRWLFILEGIPSCLSSVLVFFFLSGYPETSKWLSAEEKALAAARLQFGASHGHDGGLTWAHARETLTDWRLCAHCAIYFGISASFSSPPYAVAYVVTILASYSADRFNARGVHAAMFSTIGAFGFLASAVLPADAYHPCTGAVELAIAINISVGASGQIAGVWNYKADEAKQGYPTGHWTNAGLLFFVAAGRVGLRLYYGLLNRRRVSGGSAGEVKILYRY